MSNMQRSLLKQSGCAYAELVPVFHFFVIYPCMMHHYQVCP